MSKDVIGVKPETRAIEALELMIRNNIRRLVIGKGEGIVTIRDIVYSWQNLNEPVSKISSKEVYFVSPDADIKEAIKLMAIKGIGSLLVGSKDNIIGIVTERDIVRNVKAPQNVKVSDIMGKNPLLTVRDASVLEVIEFLKSNWQRHAIIVEERRPVGVVSVKDIGRILLSRRDLREIKVNYIMSSSVIVVNVDANLEYARFLMSQRNIGFLPAVSPFGLEGYVSEKEIIGALSV
ncbi:MAG: CBS domain-containing protein [Metallosphaera sp.]